MGTVLVIALLVVTVAVLLGAWGITTDDPGEEVLDRDEREISGGRRPGESD